MKSNDLITNFNLQRSRYDHRHFYEWLGYTWGNHIGEWFELFNDRRGKSVHRVLLIAPRDHSKSTTLRIKALHSLLFERWRNKPFTTWLFSASKDLAANRLEEIKEDLKRHPELSRMIDESKSNKWKLQLTNGAWIKASSVGSAIRGEHPARIILDDVLDDGGDKTDEDIRQWFRKKLTPMLSPQTSIFVVGTPLSLTDLYHTEMLENIAWVSWKKGSVLNYDEWVKNPEEVEPIALWKEYRPIEFLLEQRDAMGELAFSQEYLCRVVDDASAVFPQHITRKHLQMETFLEKEKLHEGRYVIGFDPSHGIGKDYSVMVVMRQDKEGFLHVVDIWRRNDFEPSKQAQEIIRLCTTYKNPIFAAESAGFQRLYHSLLQNMGANVDYRPSPVSNRVLKQGLLMRMRAWFEQGKVVFPYGDHETRTVVNELLHELETHAWDGGLIVDKGKHNDIVMALAHAIDQFKNKTTSSDSPMVSKGVSLNSWKGKASPRNPTSNGRFVSFRP